MAVSCNMLLSAGQRNSGIIAIFDCRIPDIISFSLNRQDIDI